MATASLDCNKYLHTNLYDPGDYNIENLISRYDARNFTFTTDYCSINDGIQIDQLRDIYNSYSIFADCSIKSATALSMLEAMKCGCVPVGPKYGRVGEIISEMPEGLQFFVPYNIFVGQNEEEFAIVSPDNLHRVLKNLLDNREALSQASHAAIAIANKYTNQKFAIHIVDVVNDVRGKSQEIALDCIY
jgi:glycosyltransferase involved in cell wall biosynthesis